MKKWEKIVIRINRCFTWLGVGFLLSPVLFMPLSFLNDRLFMFMRIAAMLPIGPMLFTDIPVGITGIILSRKHHLTKDMYFTCGFNILVGCIPWVLAYLMTVR